MVQGQWHPRHVDSCVNQLRTVGWYQELQQGETVSYDVEYDDRERRHRQIVVEMPAPHFTRTRLRCSSSASRHSLDFEI